MNRNFLALVLGILLPLGCSDDTKTQSPASAAGQGASGVGTSAGSAAAPGGAAGTTGGIGTPGTAGVRAPIAGATTPSAGAGGASAGASGDDEDAGVPPVGGGGAAGAAGAAGGAAGGSANVPMTGTFPAVTDLAADGPYTAKTVTTTGPNNAYTLYHPTELAPGGVLNPIVSWGNGGATVPSFYPMLPRLATHGFVVIASDSSFATGPLLKAGIDWVVAQNDDPSSVFYQKLDADNVAGVGYSLGGLATNAIADDPRFVTIVIISGANMADKTPVQKLHTPTAYFCTADMDSKGNCDGDFEVVTVPAFYGVMEGTGHVDVVFVPETANLLSKVTTSWLRWHQMQDLTQKSMFVGPDCTLCKDSAWTVMQKNGLN